MAQCYMAIKHYITIKILPLVNVRGNHLGVVSDHSTSHLSKIYAYMLTSALSTAISFFKYHKINSHLNAQFTNKTILNSVIKSVEGFNISLKCIL